MKITGIRPWLVKIPWDANAGKDYVRVPSQRGFVFVQVDTDEGVTVWGKSRLTRDLSRTVPSLRMCVR